MGVDVRAAQVLKTGQPDGVQIGEVPEPDEQADLVIDVRAAGVGFPDVLMSRGEFQVRREPPFTLGWEASGVVSRAAAGSGFAVGDRVVSMAFGAYAERVEAQPALTFALPDELSFEEGAANPLNYLTAYAGLVRRGRLQAGESVLVHGAGGGVGSAALQLAKALGASTYGVVSSEDKEQVARQAGADHVLRSDGSWRQELQEMTGDGVNVVFDPVGGRRFLDSLRSLSQEGRLVIVGFADGEIPQIPANRLLLKNTDVCGCTWGLLAAEPRGVSDAGEELNRLAQLGSLRPIVGAVHPLDAVDNALALVRDRRSTGKTVLSIGG
jgi:NADPH2:quinone reductase